MFHFQKKKKALPVDIIHRKRGFSTQKPAMHHSALFMQQENESHPSRSNFYWLYMFLWVLFAGVTVYILLFSSFLRLHTIHIEGLTDISEQEIEQFIQQEMSAKYAGIIPQDTLLIFPLSRIESAAKDRFKKIRSMEMTKTFPHTLTVKIEERKTLVLWCVAEDCFYIDENGYAYAPVDVSQSGELSGNFLKITDTSAQSIDTNEPLLDREFMRFAVDVRSALQQTSGVEIDTECSTPSRFSDELIVKTQEGWVMYVNVRLPLEKIANTLQLLLKKEISSDRRQRLKYIDMRTENRVYYSVEGETVSAPNTEEEQSAQTTPSAQDEKTAKKDKKKP